MALSLLIALLIGCFQPTPPVPPPPPATAPAQPPTPAPAAAPPASPATSAATPTLDQLEPASRRAVEKHAASFIVTQDGTWWDRQLWLERQELRERLKRSASPPPKPTDHQRALGVSKDAPSDPYDDVDGIRWTSWQLKSGEVKHGYRYRLDHTAPPLWRTIGGRAAVTPGEIATARNAHREKMGIWQLKAEMEKGKLSSFRESVTPEELAAAIKDGKAELSEFRWVKRVLTKEAFERKNEHGGTTRQARPEEAEYSWVREPVVVKWKGATPAAPVTSPPKAKP